MQRQRCGKKEIIEKQCETEKELEEQLISLAEEQATWGVRITGNSLEYLWELVKHSKQTEQG